ncbi:MAG TPA: transcription antitermination factor NusB [Candidatus Babeliales bacterium]|nr:transcription antitermination factor NusB [Candidatus Babeliales bacterium]HLC06663.1 transcription antitermination factor NusB [Candidatus Babeliales bacterium]
MCSLFSSSEEITKQDSEQQAPKSYDDLSRRDVRSLVFHFLYAAEAFNYEESVESIIDSFNRGFDLNIPLDGELANIVNAIVTARDELEKTYEPYLANWRSERVSVCTKLILLFAIWELKNTETDARIIINEAIELAKCFAEEDAYRFVNGILDPVSKEFRKESSISTES